MAVPWTQKHRPRRSDEVLGQAGVKELAQLLKQGKKGMSILLHGCPGTGKTSSVHAIAQEFDLELIEVNASDKRNADSINAIIGEAGKQGSIFGRKRIILVDEIDGISGNQDRGGVPELSRAIATSQHPIVMTAEDAYDQKFKQLRKQSTVIEYPALAHSTIYTLLTKIAEAENITYDDGTLRALARQSEGDARSAINDFQALSQDGKFTKEDLESLGVRERSTTMENALLRIFKTTDAELARSAFGNVDEDLDKIFLWIEENLPREYTRPEDRARAFGTLSDADRFFGRIRRWQYYRFYAYCYDLLSAGIALSKDEKYLGTIQYKPTTRLLKIWIANQKTLKQKAVAQRIGETTHCSSKRARNDTLPYLQRIARLPRGKAWADALGLSKDEYAWLAT